MPDTFGGTWNRPQDDGRGHSRRQLEDRASFDNQPQTNYGGCLLIALVSVATAAVFRRRS
ncbi:hypothetical protein [Streptomyces spinosisporus]|uniref:PGF-CTERM sorting domain-containing protein n=1 Tax=Streptomyces spinosisporus TaxID=2927582 RepID=A0ABS9XE07_9ACTN|nr:hypothetical protein [Streptomyces spinosisporus]MCI3240269.1 hypothetical protein [Streptomyces spinosisporus]